MEEPPEVESVHHEKQFGHTRLVYDRRVWLPILHHGPREDAVFCPLEVCLNIESTVTPPVARPEPTPTTLHGQTLEDNYRWMRDKSSLEVTAYLEAENAYTSSAMAGTEDFQAKLYAEMLSHIKETDES